MQTRCLKRIKIRDTTKATNSIETKQTEKKNLYFIYCTSRCFPKRIFVSFMSQRYLTLFNVEKTVINKDEWCDFSLIHSHHVYLILRHMYVKKKRSPKRIYKEDTNTSLLYCPVPHNHALSKFCTHSSCYQQ